MDAVLTEIVRMFASGVGVGVPVLFLVLLSRGAILRAVDQAARLEELAANAQSQRRRWRRLLATQHRSRHCRALSASRHCVTPDQPVLPGPSGDRRGACGAFISTDLRASVQDR